MLPLSPISTLKRSAIAAVAALSIIAVPMSPAYAWGDNEQNFLKGVAAAVIVGQVIKNTRRNTAPAPMYLTEPQYQRPPVYQEPAYNPPRYQEGYNQSHYNQPRYHQPAPSVSGTAAARAFQSYSSGERRMIQKRLAAYGYYGGRVDGSFGPATYRAVVAYARDEGAVRNLDSAGGAYALYDGLIY